jgi:hypothetical protein
MLKETHTSPNFPQLDLKLRDDSKKANSEDEKDSSADSEDEKESSADSEDEKESSAVSEDEKESSAGSEDEKESSAGSEDEEDSSADSEDEKESSSGSEDEKKPFAEPYVGKAELYVMLSVWLRKLCSAHGRVTRTSCIFTHAQMQIHIH